jgi:HK97 family phage major capsid protein
MLDLITLGQTDSDAVSYVEMTGFTNAAAETAEATAASGSSGTKPESAMALAIRETTVRQIAHWIPATKRSLADAGQLRTLLEGVLELGLDLRLDQQIVSGDGVGENLRGIRNTVGIGAVALRKPATTNGLTPENVLDTIHRAITVVRLAFFEPTAIGINPVDWETVRLQRSGKAAVANTNGGAAGSAAEGDYLMGDPSQAGSERLWGLIPVVSAAFAQGHPVIGDYRQAVLWLRQGTQILASDSHMDFFVRNLVAILAELRAAFGVLAAPAFCEADLT